MAEHHSPTKPGPADPSLRRLNVPKRRSSQNALAACKASDMAFTTPSTTQEPTRTIPSRGRSTSPIRSGRQARRAPSRTFVPPVVPIDILDFAVVHHPRISVAIKPSAPLCVGGATVEGDVYLTIDSNKENSKAWPPISMGRIVVSLVGVEYSRGRQWIFRSLATDLIDEEHPPPDGILVDTAATFGVARSVRPSNTLLPFRIDLPVNVGPPPYKSKKLGIKYVLSVTVEARISEKVQFARTSQELAVLTVHDRRPHLRYNLSSTNFHGLSADMYVAEKALVNLSAPLVASDELHISNAGAACSIKLTAGLHRQTWISGYILFIDILVDNRGHKKLEKIDILLEKATLHFKSAASAGLARSLRLPDHVTKEIVCRKTMKDPQDHVAPRTEAIRTCRLDIPVGLVSIDTGRFFGVRFFVSVRISCSYSKRLMVELPITIIHPNSVDVPPNALAQVAAAVEYKHRDHLFQTGSPYRYTAGRAFAAARERPHDEVKARTLPSPEMRDVAMHLDGSPRKVRHRSSHIGLGSRNSNVPEKRDSRPVSRPQTSLATYGPELQRTTSGLGFDDDSDKENHLGGLSPRSRRDNRRTRRFSRVEGGVLGELSLARKRSSILTGYKNVAAEASRAQR